MGAGRTECLLHHQAGNQRRVHEAEQGPAVMGEGGEGKQKVGERRKAEVAFLEKGQVWGNKRNLETKVQVNRGTRQKIPL